jgi:hypothetical protein
MENMQRNASIAVAMVDREAMIFHPDLNAEFLGQFSLKTFFKRFLCLPFPSRELPQSSQMRPFLPSGDQDLPGTKNQSRSDIKMGSFR